MTPLPAPLLCAECAHSLAIVGLSWCLTCLGRWQVEARLNALLALMVAQHRGVEKEWGWRMP